MRLLVPGVLFGTALLLGGAILYEAVTPLDPVTIETPRLPARRPAALRPPAYAPPPAESFADIDARPLFSAKRRPLADLQASGAAAATSDFVLVGVIMGGERAVALLRNKSTAATTSAGVGDLVNGWRVARIDATAVTLHANGGEFVVPLDGPANRPPSAPLTALAPVPAATPAPAPPPSAATVVAPAQPAAAAPPPKTAAVPASPGLAAHHPTIAPEALIGAPVDPTTGEPTL
ncbi:MAG: hypothetical protein WDN08_07705 [Rhizomicrobium sp.]